MKKANPQYLRKNWKLSRRAFIRAKGCLLSLPLLEVMLNDHGKLFAQDAATNPSQVNLLFGAFPHGHLIEYWTADKSLEPLYNSFADKFSKITGISRHITSPSDAGSPATDSIRRNYAHLGRWMSLSTGYGKYSNARNYSTLSVSWDYQLAQMLSHNHAALGGHSFRYNGHVNVISYDNNGRQITPSRNLSADFDKFVLGITSNIPAAPVSNRREIGKSVLDFLKDEKNSLYKKVSSNDQKILNDYFDQLRELEIKIESTPPPIVVSNVAACQSPAKPSQLSRLDYETFNYRTADIIALLFQCGKARVASHLFTPHAGNDGSHPGADYHGIHHDHHDTRNNNRHYSYLSGVDRKRIAVINYTAQKLDSIVDVNGKTLLDNSVLLYMSECSANHGGSNMPCLVLGKGGGALATGKDINAGGKTQLDLFHTLANVFGKSLQNFGGKSNSIISQLLS